MRSHLFETNVEELLNPPLAAEEQNRLLELVAAASKSVYPTQAQAARIFSELMASAAAGGEALEKVKSGCVSSEGWHVQQGLNLPGEKSDPRSLDSKGEGN